MHLICPHSTCPNHHPPEAVQWFDYHGSYQSCGQVHQRYRCRSCGRTFSARTLSIDYWTHRLLDYRLLIELFAGGFSCRGLSRQFATTVKTIQNRFARLARAVIATLSAVQQSVELSEPLVADGLENFFVSQDFPADIHILVGKDSQYTYGLNYALMRRKGRKTEEQKRRCRRLYQLVDFTRHTITAGFTELIAQMKRVAGNREPLLLYTDEKSQYRWALAADEQLCAKAAAGSFTHVRISSRAARTLHNDLFSVNYIDREVRKDLPEFHRQTVCFARNVGNGLERLCVYLYHHNFIKRYRIGVSGEERNHAQVAGLDGQMMRRIEEEVTSRRYFIADEAVEKGGFFDELWRRQIPTPLKATPDYLPKFAVA